MTPNTIVVASNTPMGNPALDLSGGFYSLGTAARFTNLQPRRVRRWLADPTKESEHKPVLFGDLAPIEGEIALSFFDLIEIRMVKLFLDHGVRLPAIRQAAQAARDLFEDPHPFCLRRFETDGKTVFARLRKDQSDDPEVRASDDALLDLATSQYGLPTVLGPTLRQIDFNERDVAARWWPQGRAAGVVLDPRRKFGAPVVASCGIPSAILFAAYSAENDFARVANWHGVTPEEVRLAVRFERRMARA